MWRVFWVRLGAPYLCVWSGHLAAGRFLCTAPGPVAVSVFCVCLGSLWGVFCVLLWAVLGTAGPIIVWVSGSVAWRFLRTAGGPVAWPVLGTVGGCCGGVLRAVGPEGLLWSACSVGVRLVGWRIFCAQVGAYFRARLGPGGVARIPGAVGAGGVACSVFRLRVFLFVMRWIVPLCLILTEFFPPSPERAETLCRNLLFEGTMLMPSDLGLCYFMCGP